MVSASGDCVMLPKERICVVSASGDFVWCALVDCL